MQCIICYKVNLLDIYKVNIFDIYKYHVRTHYLNNLLLVMKSYSRVLYSV